MVKIQTESSSGARNWTEDRKIVLFLYFSDSNIDKLIQKICQQLNSKMI